MEKNAKATEPSLVASSSSQVLISLVCKCALWSGRKDSERQQELSFREKDKCCLPDTKRWSRAIELEGLWRTFGRFHFAVGKLRPREGKGIF